MMPCSSPDNHQHFAGNMLASFLG